MSKPKYQFTLASRPQSTSNIKLSDALTTKISAQPISGFGERTETAYEQMKSWKDGKDQKQTQLCKASQQTTSLDV